MKKSIFRRSIAGMLAFAFLLTTMLSVGGTTAFAAGTQEKVYIVSFPRSGDVSSNTGWGHPAHSYLNGWSAEKSEWTITRAIGGYNGQACYCIEPGVSQQTGDTLTQKDYRLMLNFQCTVGCIATGFVLLLAYDFYKNQKRFSLVLMLLHTLIACLSGTRGYMLVCIVVTITSILLFSSLKQKLLALPLLLAGVLMERFNVMEFIFHSLRFGESTGRRQSEDLFVIWFMPKRPLLNILFGNGFGSPIGKYRISRSIIYEVADSRYTLKVLPKVEGFHNCWSTILYSSGIVGLILIVLLYGSIILQAMRAATDNRFRMILLSFLVSYAVLLWFRWTATSGILEFACLSYVIHDLKNHNRAEQLSLSRAESCQIQKKTEERSWTSYSP